MAMRYKGYVLADGVFIPCNSIGVEENAGLLVQDGVINAARTASNYALGPIEYTGNVDFHWCKAIAPTVADMAFLQPDTGVPLETDNGIKHYTYSLAWATSTNISCNRQDVVSTSLSLMCRGGDLSSANGLRTEGAHVAPSEVTLGANYDPVPWYRTIVTIYNDADLGGSIVYGGLAADRVDIVDWNFSIEYTPAVLHVTNGWRAPRYIQLATMRISGQLTCYHEDGVPKPDQTQLYSGTFQLTYGDDTYNTFTFNNLVFETYPDMQGGKDDKTLRTLTWRALAATNLDTEADIIAYS